MGISALVKRIIGPTEAQKAAWAETERINKEYDDLQQSKKEYNTRRAQEAQKRSEAWKAEQAGWYTKKNTSPVETPVYTPIERTNPWEKSDWGSRDVVRTPPREKPKKEDNPYRPQLRGVERDQRDYAYMPTETEVRREDERWTREQKAKESEPWQQRPDPGTEFMGRYIRKPPTLIIR